MRHCLMGFFFFFFIIFFYLFSGGLSEFDLSIGNRITISIPITYKAGFQGNAFFLKSEETVPGFKAALSVETFDGRYLCSLVVILGDLEVWNSRRFSRFFPSGSCVLELMKNGVLQLRDSSGEIGWRTATSGQGVERLQLLRTGNLVLTDAKNLIKWQSFDFPAHIILWGQRLNVPSTLTAPATDSTSFYTLEIQDDKIALYLHAPNLNYSYWEFKPTKSRRIKFVELGSTGLKFFNSIHRKVAQITSIQNDPIKFLALGKTGNLVFYHYSAYKGKFESSFQVLESTCDLPLTCGPYGICSSSNSCTCMQFSGRLEHIQSECDEGFSDGFCDSNVAAKMVKLDGVTSVLRGTHPSVNISEEECMNLCLVNCSCAAVLFSDADIAGRERECFHFEMVGGLKQDFQEVGMSYLVKVPQEMVEGSSHSSSGIRKWLLIMGGVVNILAIVFILGGFLFYIIRKKRMKNEGSENT